MASSLADVFVTVRPDASKFGPELERKLNSVDGSKPGEEVGNKYSGGFGRGLSRLGGIVKAGAGIFGGLAVAGATVGVKTAAGMEQAKIGFTTMLGSGQKANAFLQQLSAFAAKTPFEFPELQTAASSLISAGISADKVIPIMTTLGDVTSGMGTGAEGVQRATIALQQMNAAGRITGEDLNQLRDAGIPVYDLLAKATGKSKAEIVKLAQAGKLGKTELDQMMKALESGKGLERFSGLMEKQSASLSGLASTFHDTLTMGLSTAIQPLIPLLKDGMLVAINLVTAAMPKLAAGLATGVTFLQSIGAAFTGATANTKGLSDGAARIATSIGGMAGQVGPFLSTIFGIIRGGDVDTSKLSDRMALLAVNIGDRLQPVVQSVIGWFHNLITSFQGGGGGVSGLGSAFTSMGDSLSKLAPVFAGMLGNLRTVSGQMPSFTSVVQTAAGVLKFMADHTYLLIPALAALTAGFVVLKTAQAANAVVGKNSAIGFYVSTAASIADVAAKFAQAGANRALAAAINGSTLSVERETAAQNVSMLTRIRNTAGMVAQRVASVAVAAGQRALAAGQWLVNAAMSANPIGLVVIALTAMVAAVVIAYKSSSTFRAIVQGAWAGIKGAVSAAWGAISPVLSTFASVMRNVLGTAVSWLWHNAITPAFNGIRTAISVVWTVIRAYFGAWNTILRTVVGPTISWLWRNVAVPAFNGVRAVISGAWNLIRGYFAAWNTVLRTVVGPTVSWLWRNVVSPTFTSIRGGIQTAWRYISATFTSWKTGMGLVGSKISGVWTGTIRPTFSSIVAGIRTAWTSMSGTFTSIKNGIGLVGSKISGVYTGTIRPTWNSIKSAASSAWTAMSGTFTSIKNGIGGVGTKISGVWTGSIKPTFDKLSTFVRSTLATKFSGGVSAIKTAWDKLQNVAKAPVNFIITTVYDKGLRGVFNKVASVVGSSTRLPYIGGLATGGPVPLLPGSTRSRDSVLAMVQPGEFVVRQDGSNIEEAIQHFGVRGYSIGGWIADKVSAIGGAISGAASKVKVTATSVIGWIQGMLGKMTGPIISNIRGLLAGAGSSPLAGLAKSAGSKLLSSLTSWITGKDKAAASAGGGAYTGPVPGGGAVTRWSSTVLQALSALHQSPSWLSTVLRRLNQESGGNPNAQNNWDVNAQNGVPSQGLMQVIPPTFAAYAGPYRGLGIRNPLANIYAGLNYAIHRYGSLSALNRPGGYRDGGMLNPGQLGFNETRRPERVLTTRQTEAFERLVQMLDSGSVGTGSGMTVQVTNHHPVAEPASVTVNRSLQFAAALGR